MNETFNLTAVPQINSVLEKYSPKLLINNPITKENVLSSVVEGLTSCQAFRFVVAFVTESGLAMLKSHLIDLKRKGIAGKLLTSTYLFFNNPKVFRELLKIDNLEVRLTDLEGFHSKGYIFDYNDDFFLIIGSANLTAQALKINYEWNVSLTVNANTKFILEVNDQFEEIWNRSESLTETWIKNYEILYVQHTAKQIMKEELTKVEPIDLPNQSAGNSITPNKMQNYALAGIQEVRDAGHQRALIVSATGTGKTYLSAFDVKNFNPKRMLFIAHREQILLKAKSDFEGLVSGSPDEYGLLSGTGKHIGAKYLFATVQTISKPEVLSQFDPRDFDYILIDEVHKAGAASYRRVIDYFAPEFMMGMTATPERTDDFNIYELFNYNVAYEIRLQEALEEDMLCPFHYFGVTDLELNGETIDDTTILSKLVTEERVSHLIEKIEYYGYSGQKVKGLIFCSRKDEAIELSVKMNGRGYETVALTGEDSIEQRELQVQKLEHGDLDYIITVDIFNEGIDIPTVNQVVMLRQTQSSIVFIQQLGRGLRKHKAKEFVTIIDFIGNYKNNYLIPIALSGDRSLNKDNIRRKMKDTSYINGLSSINFEEVAKEQIYKSINNTNLTELKKLKEAYQELKNRIGRMPFLIDFIQHNLIDPGVITDTHKSYHHFLLRIREDVPSLTNYEAQVMEMISKEILNGKRRHEIVLLDLLINQGVVSHDRYVTKLMELNCPTDERTISSIRRIMDLSFFVASDREKYGNVPICTLDEDNYYRLNETMKHSLATNHFFKKLFRDVVDSAAEKSRMYDPKLPLTVYQKYTRKDFCRLLGWENDEKGTIFGYAIKNDMCPIFVTYHKKESVASSTNYGDEFLSPTTLKWFTRSKRTLRSEEVRKIVEANENDLHIQIFVKKDDDEGGSDFYYLGKAKPDPSSVQQTTMSDDGSPVVCMNLILEHAVDPKLYRYIITDYKN
ncbi:helicase [Cohnella kolymensis]|uniref:Helicase n=1 Tax=Cohnella kolymensis TaxID=1590652 RepID=A0ABR5ABH0_9BACL|nr:DEAD/DEAH box helicase [Cohnella kolymensis]KIL37722.1 helicase [Cohnella kolymensis]